MSWQLQFDPSSFDRDFSFLTPFFRSTAFTDSSKTSLRPSRVRAEHSRYIHLSYDSMRVLAVSLAMGASFGSVVVLERDSLRSILLPTKILTAPGTIF